MRKLGLKIQSHNQSSVKKEHDLANKGDQMVVNKNGYLLKV